MKATIKDKVGTKIGTIYGDFKYSHSEDDADFSRNDSKYCFDNGYAVVHSGGMHHIYVR